jgi:hypothetical protein
VFRYSIMISGTYIEVISPWWEIIPGGCRQKLGERSSKRSGKWTRVESNYFQTKC